MTNRRTGATDVSTPDSNNDHHDHEVMERRQEEKEIRSESIQSKSEKRNEETLPDLRQTVMSKHIETRRKLKEIADISSFTSLINAATLSHTDKQLLLLHYIDEKDFQYIGDMLGFSESTIKKRHKKALNKLSKML